MTWQRTIKSLPNRFADVMGAIMNASGHTPATVGEKKDQIDLAVKNDDHAINQVDELAPWVVPDLLREPA